MAVHAVAVCQVVIGNHLFFKVLDITFAQLDGVPYFITRFYQPVAYKTVYLFGSDLPGKRRILQPLAVYPGGHFNCQRLPFLRFQQVFPFAERETGFPATCHRQALFLSADSDLQSCSFVAEQEVQRSDIIGDGYIRIVRIDRSRFADFRHLFGLGDTCRTCQ